MSHSTIRTAIGHALFLLAASQGLQAASFAYIAEAGANNVSVIETANHRVVGQIPVGRWPHGVAVSAAGTRVYVTNAADNTVSTIDATANRVVATIAVGPYPTGVAVNPSGTLLYVVNSGNNSIAGSVSVIDADANTVIADIPVGIGPGRLALSSDGTRLYVANWKAGISVIDTATRLVVATILGEPTASVAIDAQGKRLYATLYGNSEKPGSVAVIDASSLAILGSLSVGWRPGGIALNPAGTRAYVANMGDDEYSFDSTVSVIDTSSLLVVATVGVGSYPNGISVDPSGTHVYVTNSDSDSVSAIDAATNTVTATIKVGSLPISYGNFFGPPNAALVPDSYQGLWWNSPAGSESGWGLNLTQQGDILFATWFTYDADGSGLWLVMSNGVRTNAATYTGTLYRTTGSPFNATWNPAAMKSTPVGSATFSFSDSDNGVFTHTLNGSTHVKAITRQIFSLPALRCTIGGTAGATPNYQDLWWRSPAGSQSGWGVNLAHQGDILFATWFTYDANGKGQWLVMSNGVRTGSDTYSGVLYRMTGPAYWNSGPAFWNPAKVTTTPVGTATFSFSDSGNGTFAYALDGISQSQPITRQVFSAPATVCK